MCRIETVCILEWLDFPLAWLFGKLSVRRCHKVKSSTSRIQVLTPATGACLFLRCRNWIKVLSDYRVICQCATIWITEYMNKFFDLAICLITWKCLTTEPSPLLSDFQLNKSLDVPSLRLEESHTGPLMVKYLLVRHKVGMSVDGEPSVITHAQQHNITGYTGQVGIIQLCPLNNCNYAFIVAVD